MARYIEINKASIPYRFDLQLSNKTYTFEVHHNAEHDFFTVDLYQGEETLILGEKLLYGKPLFSTVKNTSFPDDTIIPLDVTGAETRITYKNLNESILLYVLSQEEIESAE